MTASPILAEYLNGDYAVRILADGTKIRRALVDAPSRVLVPESMDLKITDYCDAGCGYCHEQSTVRGAHADLAAVLRRLDGLPPGVEIAIGGGNPLSHPDLRWFLEELRERQLIANLTINEQHWDSWWASMRVLRAEGLVHGVGVSIQTPSLKHTTIAYTMPWVVWHVIAGVASPLDLLFLRNRPSVLVLGYKFYGRGSSYAERSPLVAHRLRLWEVMVGRLLATSPNGVSFDNLALEQLHVKERIRPEAWTETFMGHDGEFTMYFDGVRQEFARSSTSPRVSAGDQSVIQYFQTQRELR